MTSEAPTLAFSNNKVLSDTTVIHQLEDGTIFYRDGTSLWVKYNEKKIEKTLPGGFKYSIMAAFGNSLYYGSNWKKKIYKVEFKPPDVIDAHPVRKMLGHENLHPGGMCSIVDKETDRVKFYRLCDDPDDGFLLDIVAEKFAWLELKGKLGNTAILRNITDDNVVPGLEFGKNSAVLACNRGTPRRFMEILNTSADMTEYYPPWGSPAVVKDNGLVYMSNGESLFVLDIAINSSPVRGKMLPPLRFSNVSAFHIAGIHNGLLTGRGKCKKDGKYYMMTAQLGPEYIRQKPESQKPEYDEGNAQDPATMGTEKLRSTIEIPSTNVETSLIMAKHVAGTREQFSSSFQNNYEVHALIGEGGFGCVIKVTNKTDKKEYAVKRIAKLANEMEEASNEAKVMSNFDHPHIVRYNTSWIEEPPNGWQRDADIHSKIRLSDRLANITYKCNCQYLYIQMEICKQSLSDWLKNNQSREDRNLARIKMWFKQLVDAVGYIHGKNRFHRDLKPGNILFLEDDNIKLCDLGIVADRKDDDDTQTKITRTYAGTELYMSPEQKGKIAHGSKSDVFTLGLILAELCLVMTSSERTRIFDNYRDGKQCELIKDTQTADFIKTLTRKDENNRPSCKEILADKYLDGSSAWWRGPWL